MKGPNKSSNIKKNIGIFKFLSHIQKDLTKKVIIQKITKTVNGMYGTSILAFVINVKGSFCIEELMVPRKNSPLVFPELINFCRQTDTSASMS